MNQLLHAGLSRSFKSTLVRACFGVMLVTALFAGGIVANTAQKTYVEVPAFVEDCMVAALPMLPFVCAVLVALLLGSEYEQGTIRNKLAAGHTRAAIYASSLAVCLVTTLALLVVLLLVGVALGWAVLGDWLLPPAQLALVVAACCLASAALSTICVALTMNLSNRAVAVTVLLVLLYGMFIASGFFESALHAAEFSYEYVVMTTEGIQYGPLAPNPEYASGTKRAVYEFLYSLLPTSQIAKISNSEFESCSPLWLVLSLGVAVVTGTLGYLGFRSKDIK